LAEAGPVVSLALSGDALYVGTFGDATPAPVYALRTGDGTTLWQAQGEDSQVAISDGIVYLSETIFPELAGADPTGTTRWAVALPNGPMGPVIAGT
jgi:outer membrane protein assembly factor BamB